MKKDKKNDKDINNNSNNDTQTYKLNLTRCQINKLAVYLNNVLKDNGTFHKIRDNLADTISETKSFEIIEKKYINLYNDLNRRIDLTRKQSSISKQFDRLLRSNNWDGISLIYNLVIEYCNSNKRQIKIEYERYARNELKNKDYVETLFSSLLKKQSSKVSSQNSYVTHNSHKNTIPISSNQSMNNFAQQPYRRRKKKRGGKKLRRKRLLKERKNNK